MASQGKTKVEPQGIAAFLDGVEPVQRQAEARRLVQVFGEVTGFQPLVSSLLLRGCPEGRRQRGHGPLFVGRHVAQIILRIGQKGAERHGVIQVVVVPLPSCRARMPQKRILRTPPFPGFSSSAGVHLDIQTPHQVCVKKGGQTTDRADAQGSTN